MTSYYALCEPKCKIGRTRMHSSRMHTACSSSHWGMSASVHAGIHTPWVWVWSPPPRCEPGDPPGQTPQLPPWVWAWRPPWPDPSTYPLVRAWKPARHAGIPPPLEICCKACWDTTCNACWDTNPPSHVNRITDTCKNITLPQLRCGR